MSNLEIHEDCQRTLNDEADSAYQDPMSRAYGASGIAVESVVRSHIKHCEKCRSLNRPSR